MTLDELKKVKESLEELCADVQIGFGPSYELANRRKAESLSIINRAIKEKKNALDPKYSTG